MSYLRQMLKECCKAVKPTGNNELYEEVVNNCKLFPIAFPVGTVKCQSLLSQRTKEELTSNISSTYPLCHENVLVLACQFILFKRANGTTKEKALYENMDLISFMDRLLKNRSVSFYGAIDKYILYSKHRGSGGWDLVGTDGEKPPLLLRDCLSYDEMRLSAMLYVSGHTEFINNGSRFNAGNVENNNKIEKNGVITGLIGTRFEVEGLMEWQDMIVDSVQNRENKGYGDTNSGSILEYRRLWGDFYQLPRLTYNQARDIFARTDKLDMKIYEKYLVSDGRKYFDNRTYEKHMTIPFDCILLEANARGLVANKSSYLHLVGIGLGVWKAFSHQNQVFVNTFLERVRCLVSRLPGLSDVHFSYFRDIDPDILPNSGIFIECSTHPLGGIQIHLSNREPSSKLVGKHEGKLLVESYAWDGNAQPGNEFWDGSLTGSGDPAAACSSQVAELHNSHINPRFVCGNNLHVAGQHGLLHVSEYVNKIIHQFAE